MNGFGDHIASFKIKAETTLTNGGDSGGDKELQNKKDLESNSKSLILLAGTTRLELATSGVTGRPQNEVGFFLETGRSSVSKKNSRFYVK